MRTLVLIPAHNEAASLPAVVADLRQQLPRTDILVVDDASSDETTSVLPALGVKWLRLCQRLGPGAAVKAGLRYATDRGYDVVVRIDGDGQHPASEIAPILVPIHEDRADVAIGSRFIDGGAATSVRRLSQKALGAVLSLLVGRRVTDPTSGLWAFGPRSIGLLADHHPSGYPEAELRLFLSRNAMRVVEVPVKMRARFAGRSTLTAPRTSAALARLLLALIVVPLRSAVGLRSRSGR